MNKKERIEGITGWFRENRPDAEAELRFENPFQLLVAVMLSAQCTDKRVNMVTPPLFARFPDAASMAASSPQEIFEYIKSVSYPNSKAAHLHGAATRITECFGGEVPSDREGLESLPGVGRKSAGVLLAILFSEPVVPVDTHVFRVARRLGLSRGKTPLAVEKDLTAAIAPAERGKAHHWLILHGRYICTARNPKCPECGISPWCLEHGRREKRGAKQRDSK